MKATLEVNSKYELKRMLMKKQPITIRLPNIARKTNKIYYWSLIGIFGIMVLIGITCHYLGYQKGASIGWSMGYDKGFDDCSTRIFTFEKMTLSQAIAENVKLNLNQYIKFVGIVVGIGWILHGVGFKII